MSHTLIPTRFLKASTVAIFSILSICSSHAEETSVEAPEAIRFVKTPLSTGEFYEPVEMAILPNLDVLIVQRRGEILLYEEANKEIYRVGFLDAYFESDAEGVNAEEGVLGITADPDFAENHFVYIYYSPRDKVVNRLSRFVFENRTLNMESEKVILELYSQRDICCHTGGSLAFGPDRLLYLSTGDNSTPFDEPGAEYVNDGFAPLNDLEGKQQYDARRSSANTNDLRGKILRIRVLPDGSYEIPEGNLFPATDKTRPEIYTMGHRNPYRISVDKKTGTVYWGDVGPDANEDTTSRGPRGYDEMNRAPEAGNYGWPLFVGDNNAYRDYDYSTGESGPAFDPKAPVNDSANNTGLVDLPPANAPFITYPYAPVTDLPVIGSGGRNAMAGPVYYKEFYPQETRLPDYYSGKVIMHDWIRNWFIAVSFDSDGELDTVEPFLQNLEFSGPIDVEMGPDGRIYVLEYGSGWFQRNQDSGLSRIDYIEGNLPPQIASVSVDHVTGKIPFMVSGLASVSDPESDPIKYTWKLGPNSITTEEPSFKTTLKTAGAYELQLTATDAYGSSANSSPIQIYAGNEQPEATISVKGNQSMYFPDRSVAYQVSIKDDSKVDPNKVFVSARMQRRARSNDQGHQVISRAAQGEAIMSQSDCRACHQLANTSIGPAYEQIALKYRGDDSAASTLSNKILNGGSGVWGEVAMPAHPAMSESDVSKVVTWVLDQAPVDNSKPSLPLKGKISPTKLIEDPTRQIFTIEASYTDSPEASLLPLSTESSLSLRPNTFIRYWFTETEGFTTDQHNLLFTEKDALIQISNIDLKGIKSIKLRHNFEVYQPAKVSIRVGSSKGEIIGSGTISESNETSIRIKRVPGPSKLNDIFLSFEFNKKPEQGTQLQTIKFDTSRN